MKHNYFKAEKTLSTFARIITRWNWAYYIGGQETANRLEAQQLKNRETLLNTQQAQNKLVLQDQEIEKKKLEILKLRRELGLNGNTFTAESYPEPGNIR